MRSKASYAIVNNCLASVEIEKVFQDYCRHFKIPFQNGTEAERLYGAHFLTVNGNGRIVRDMRLFLNSTTTLGRETFRIGTVETFDADILS